MADSSRELTIAYAHRETWEMMKGVEVEGARLRVATDGTTPSNHTYTLLANDHEWDIGELAFSTYLMAADLGSSDIALPIFPAHMAPHAGVFVRTEAGIKEPAHLVDKRMGCNTFGANYSVWWRGILAHQYDVPIQRITWVQSIPEHRADYRPPSRFQIEIAPGNTRSESLLAEGKIDAVSTAGAGQRPQGPEVRALFPDPYGQIRAFAEQFGFVPLNTVIIVRRSTIDRFPDLPRALLDAFTRGRTRRQAAKRPEDEIYRSLERDTDHSLTGFGFDANRVGIREGIAYAYEQGIIRRHYAPEELFLPI